MTYVAGERAQEQSQGQEDLLKTIAKTLDCKQEQIPARATELFSKWKKAKKASKKSKELTDDLFNLTSEDKFQGDILQETSNILNTQPDHIVNTIAKFRKDLESFKK